MSNWQSCGNCRRNTKCPYWVFCEDKRSYMIAWEPIPCPLCGGSLSEVKEHKTKVGDEEVIRHYRHCFSCHMEFYEDERNDNENCC